MNALSGWFLEPGALVWSVALPALIALWMLKLRRDPVVVSSTLLWERLLSDRHVNRPLERLRRSLLLLLELLALALLAAALLRPCVRAAAVTAERVIVVLDTTASMRATDLAPTRFARAREEAARRLAALPAECEALILDAGPRPRVAAPFTRDRALLASRLEALAPAEAGGDLAEALALAADLARPRGASPARVWVFSDGGPALVQWTTAGATSPVTSSGQPGAARAQSIGLDPALVSFFRFAGEGENVGVVQVQALRVGARPVDYEVFAQVASFARGPRTVSVDLRRDTTLVDSRRVLLPPGERAAVVFTGSHAGPARLTVAVDGGDALALDDRAHAALPAAVTRRVTLAGDPDPWLERALALIPGLAVDRAGAASLSATPAPPPGLLVSVGAVPDPWPACAVWLIAPRATSPAARVEGTFESASVIEADAEHPVLADVVLGRAHIDRGVRLLPAPVLAPLAAGVAQARETPLLCAGQLEGGRGQGAGRTVVMAFRPMDSDLPLRPALPLLVSNVVDWVHEPSERGLAARAGAPLPLRSGEELSVRDPAGDEEHLDGGRGRTADRVGFWTLAPARGPARTVAVSLLDLRESDLSPGPGPELSGRALASTGAPASSDRELSRPLLMLVFLVLLAEWLVHHRRWSA